MNAVRIVVDTNVWVSALRSRRGASFRVLSLVGTERFAMALSTPLVLEYEDAAKRQLDQLAVTAEEIDRLLDFLCAHGTHQSVFFLWRPVLPDPADDFVLKLRGGERRGVHCDLQSPGLRRGGAVRAPDRHREGTVADSRGDSMSTVQIRLPDSLYRRIQQAAEEDGISVDQFLATAAAEKLSALLTTDYLAERAARAGTREEFLRLLEKVPDVEPQEYDKQ